MRRTVLCFLLMAGFMAQAQDLTPFKDANGKYGYKDQSGKIIVQPKYDVAEQYGQEGFYAVNIGGSHNVLSNDIQGGRSGFVDRTGKVVVPLKYDYVYPNFIGGYTTVKLNGKWGIIDKTGKEATPLKYDKIPVLETYFLTEVQLNGKKGFVEKRTGKEIVPVKYDDVIYFSEDMAAVKMAGKWGFVDKTGREVIPVQYEVSPMLEPYFAFKNGKVQVSKNGRKFYIDKTGNEVSAQLPANHNTNASTNTSVNTKPVGNGVANTSGKTAVKKEETIDISTLNKLAGVWTRNNTDDQKGMFVSYLELKEVNGSMEAWRVVGGKPDIKYTRFIVFRSSKGALGFNYELNIPPGFKYEGTGAINEDMSEMKAVELQTVKDLDMPMPPVNWVAKKGATATPGTTTNNRATTSSITIPANSSAAVPEPAESKFRTAFNSATDAEGRGKALGVLFGDVYKNASLTDEQKKNYMLRRVSEVYALDKEAAFKGVMKADCPTARWKEFKDALPADQKAFIVKRAQEISSGFKQVH